MGYGDRASDFVNAARALGQTFNDIKRERIETDEVRALFEAGRTDAGDYMFEQPMLLDFSRGGRLSHPARSSERARRQLSNELPPSTVSSSNC